MRDRLKVKRGLDLRLNGALDNNNAATEKTEGVQVMPCQVAIVPDDFPGFVPRPDLSAGDAVQAGQPLAHDKACPEMCLVSPATGHVAAVVRGLRRKIERIVVDVDPTSDHECVLHDVNADADIEKLLQRSGLWAMMRQRPFDIVPLPGVRPRDIYVTAVDSAPLAADSLAWLKRRNPEGWAKELSAGVSALKTLTEGDVHVTARPGDIPEAIPGAVMHDIEGPHPAGLVGTQIALTKPINKGETVWALDVATLANIGRLMLTGRIDTHTAVAVTGPLACTPRVVDTLAGAAIKPLVEGNIKDTKAHVRVISGNVLTGSSEGLDGWLRRPYSQVTLIAEGDDVYSFMGWASLSPKHHSVSRSFLSWLMPRRKYSPDARLNGGRRAMIASGVYERMIPLDIMPEALIKAIKGRDIDKMEQLGIYEVAPEDFALAEYADPSKLKLQQEVRDGLDYLRKEL